MARLFWTPAMDARLVEMRQRGAPWRVIAASLRIGANTAQDRFRALGAREPVAYEPAPIPVRPREPYPAGHVVTWGALMQLTPSLAL